MLLPYLPGKYDSLAVSLSMMAQLFSFSGLLLVPVGVAWLFADLRKQGDRVKSYYYHRPFIVITLIILIIVLLITSLGALSGTNYLFGIIFLVASSIILFRSYRRLRSANVLSEQGLSSFPVYLVIIPVVLSLARIGFIPTAVEFSRNRAIQNSIPMINEIENYHHKHGRYPISLQALHGDYSPGLIGIPQYYYEPSGEAYNFYFKQFSDNLADEEIVMYNKLDEHAFAAHALDILQLSGEELTLQRGDRRRFSLAQPHWIVTGLID